MDNDLLLAVAALFEAAAVHSEITCGDNVFGDMPETAEETIKAVTEYLQESL